MLHDGEYSRIALKAVFTGSEVGDLTLHRAALVIDRNDEDAEIRVFERTANSVTVEVANLPDYRLLSFIDFGYPGWRAYLDGKEVPVLQAFSYFKAVEVPAGTHRVVFQYHPVREVIGILVSLWSLVVLAGILIWVGARSRAASSDPS